MSTIGERLAGMPATHADEPAAGPAIRTWALSKSYGRRPALTELDLEVPAGGVFGYLGPNGAGKTTTIRLLAGLLRPTSGRAEVLGLDTVRDRERVQRRIGYLPGDFVAYHDLTGEQYLRYLAGLRGGVDWASVERLAKRFDLDLGLRIHTLSHGNRQKVGLVQAFMHGPDLLILDEPTNGLDPIMQREFVTLLRETRDAGRTVFLSSHILSEVEAVADTVGILRAGRLVVTRSVGELKARTVRRVELTFAREVPEPALRAVPEVKALQVNGRKAQLFVAGSMAALVRAAAPYDVVTVLSHEPDLEEIFLDYYDGQE
jgi:ABC-2 type transport system ATP-binding protein